MSKGLIAIVITLVVVVILTAACILTGVGSGEDWMGWVVPETESDEKTSYVWRSEGMLEKHTDGTLSEDGRSLITVGESGVNLTHYSVSEGGRELVERDRYDNITPSSLTVTNTHCAAVGLHDGNIHVIEYATGSVEVYKVEGTLSRVVADPECEGVFYAANHSYVYALDGRGEEPSLVVNPQYGDTGNGIEIAVLDYSYGGGRAVVRSDLKEGKWGLDIAVTRQTLLVLAGKGKILQYMRNRNVGTRWTYRFKSSLPGATSIRLHRSGLRLLVGGEEGNYQEWSRVYTETADWTLVGDVEEGRVPLWPLATDPVDGLSSWSSTEEGSVMACVKLPEGGLEIIGAESK